MAISLTGFLGSIGSIATSIYNTAQSSRNADLAYNRQRSLMGLQQGYAVQNWNREANYNSPIEQMKRLKEGNLNPNLVYGSGAVGLEAPSTAAPTAPSAPMAPVVPMSNPIAEAAQAAQALALAKQAGSNAIKTDIETEYLSQSMTERLEAVGLQNKWTKEQIQKIAQEYSNLVAQCNLMRSQAETVDITNKNLDDKLKAEISNLKSSASYHNAVKGLTDSQKQLLDSTMDNLINISQNQSDFLDTSVKLLNRYGDAQAIVGMLSQVVGSVTDILTSYAKIFPKKPQ